MPPKKRGMSLEDKRSTILSNLSRNKGSLCAESEFWSLWTNAIFLFVMQGGPTDIKDGFFGG